MGGAIYDLINGEAAGVGVVWQIAPGPDPHSVCQDWAETATASPDLPVLGGTHCLAGLGPRFKLSMAW